MPAFSVTTTACRTSAVPRILTWPSDWPSRIREDDFATIQQAALIARGQLASVEGAKGAVTDYLVRLLKVRETVAAQYDTALPPDARAVLRAYADGVNYYAALHPDKVERGLLPMTRAGRGRRIRVSHALLLWSRSCVREDHGACAQSESGRHDHDRISADRLQRYRSGAVEVDGRCHPPFGQFAPALCRAGRLV